MILFIELPILRLCDFIFILALSQSMILEQAGHPSMKPTRTARITQMSLKGQKIVLILPHSEQKLYAKRFVASLLAFQIYITLLYVIVIPWVVHLYVEIIHKL